MAALGFAVLRGHRWAAWSLVAIALLDIVTRAMLGHSGYLMPGLLLAFALTAAIRIGEDRRRAAALTP
jgi:hypothetical protein